MSWDRRQALVGLSPKKAARPEITGFEPDDIGYLRGLKGALAAAGLMPRGTRPDGRVSESMLRRARAIKARMDEREKARRHAAP